ncbi:hypothetical protein EZS27_014793 [termite gut metagenome]|uniref:Lipocalin-like domain-containing protein n=1 Tax=termite gut metagenome TaxID=433724 RepID=A0A5J4RVU1_9ZZZZ
MKQLLFIFLALSPLLTCSSCQDDEDKLPGTKPEVLLGKWGNLTNVGAFLDNYIYETFEFTKTGGSIKQMKYFPEEDRYEDYHASYFTDWSYDGNYIHFLYKKGGFINTWSQPVYKLTLEFLSLGTGQNNCTVYYKIQE